MLLWRVMTDKPVAINPDASGFHRILIGFCGASGFRIRVSGESTYRWVQSTTRWNRGDLDGEEAYLRTVDLTGRFLELLPEPIERQHDPRVSQIAYLRLLAVSDDEGRSGVAALRDPARKTAGAVVDGHEALGAFRPLSVDEVNAMIEPFEESTFKRIYWGCTITSMRMCYVSDVGYHLGKNQCIEDLHSEHNRRCARSLQTAARNGYDPLEVLIHFADDRGLELWPSFRIQQDYPLDYNGGFGRDFTSPIFSKNQDWLQVDRAGMTSTHLFSHFHAGWEQYKLDLLAEIARKGPVGIHLNLMCEAGAIWDFAPHAVTRFQEIYDMSPYDGDEIRPEWYQFRCDHLSAFMRRLRDRTNEIAGAIGHPIRIAVQVSGDWSILKGAPFGARAVAANFIYGFDIGRWAREGLVDVIAPSFRRTHRPMFLDHIKEELGDARGLVELAPSLGQHVNELFPRNYEWALYFTDVGKGRADLTPFADLDPWRILREANDLYNQDADAVDCWEMGEAFVRLGRWNVLKHVGDREMLRAEFGDRIDGVSGRWENRLTFDHLREKA